MARVTRMNADWLRTSFYGGLLGGRKREGNPRTFYLEFTNQTERLASGAERAFRGRTPKEVEAFNAIINQEIQRLYDKNVRRIFRDEAPEDKTDLEPWNNPYWWQPPTLRQSIMKSPLIKRNLRKGEIELTMRMRWYGQLTIEGRGPVHAVNAKVLRFKTKDGRWVAKEAVGPATVHEDELTGESPEERMNWAGRAYYKSIPYMSTTRGIILSRLYNEVMVMNMKQAIATAMVNQKRFVRQEQIENITNLLK